MKLIMSRASKKRVWKFLMIKQNGVTSRGWNIGPLFWVEHIVLEGVV